MTDRTSRRAGNALPATATLLAVVALVAACDEEPATGPEPPPRERVEGQSLAEILQGAGVAPVEVRTVPIADWVHHRSDGSILLQRDGSVYRIESPGDTIPWYELDTWEEVTGPVYEAASWSDFDICADCDLELTEVVRFGDPDGPGMIEGAAPRVVRTELPGYVVVGSTYLQTFDDEGRFLRRFGREGEGPGEFTGIADAHVVHGRIVALDRAKRAWSIFDLAGEFVDERPYGYAAGPFVPVGRGRVVVVTMDWSPEAAGFPLHLADIESGVPSRHFGSMDDAWESAPYSHSVQGSVVSRYGTVWWGTAGSPSVQEWSVDDVLLRVIEGELPWFPEVTEFIDQAREPPSTLLRSMGVDRTQHFWMMVRQADPQWREVELEPAAEGFQIPPGRLGDYLDTRLDIFDLEEQRHVGRYVWDSPYARLFNLDGEPAVSMVEYTEEGVPQLVVYRVGWE